jgi:hypothetical protein
LLLLLLLLLLAVALTTKVCQSTTDNDGKGRRHVHTDHKDTHTYSKNPTGAKTPTSFLVGSMAYSRVVVNVVVVALVAAVTEQPPRLGVWVHGTNAVTVVVAAVSAAMTTPTTTTTNRIQLLAGCGAMVMIHERTTHTRAKPRLVG